MTDVISIIEPPEALEDYLASLPIERLAEIVNTEHSLVCAAATEALTHAVACGDALLEARDRCAAGTWMAWLEENVPFAYQTAYIYMRVALYRDKWDGEARTLTSAWEAVKGLPAAHGRGDHCRKPDWTKREALELRSQGLSIPKIADALGVSTTAVGEWINPGTLARSRQRSHERKKRIAAEKRALRRVQRDDAVKKLGGTPSHAYSYLRKCAAEMQRAIDESEDREIDRRLRQALADIHSAEEKLVRAIGVS